MSEPTTETMSVNERQAAEADAEARRRIEATPARDEPSRGTLAAQALDAARDDRAFDESAEETVARARVYLEFLEEQK